MSTGSVAPRLRLRRRVGIFFGFYPARKAVAARSDRRAALRVASRLTAAGARLESPRTALQAAIHARAHPHRPGPRRPLGLFVLTLVNLFNYLDRYRRRGAGREPEALRSSTSRTPSSAALATGFILVYMLTSPIFGTLGDRGRRPRLIAAGVASGASPPPSAASRAASPACSSPRSTVGVGEAAYGTVSPALLADYFPRRAAGPGVRRLLRRHPDRLGRRLRAGRLRRPTTAAGGRPSSSPAFPACCSPGSPRASRSAARRPGRRGAPSAAGHGATLGRQALAAYAGLLRNGPYVLTVLGYAAYTFALGALAFWTPAFLERERGLARTRRHGAVRGHRGGHGLRRHLLRRLARRPPAAALPRVLPLGLGDRARSPPCRSPGWPSPPTTAGPTRRRS